MKRAALLMPAASVLVFGLFHAIAAPSPAESPAAGDVESVTVDARNVLPGIWRFPPHERRVGFSRLGSDTVAKFGAVGPEKFCRIERADSDYTFNCLEMSERAPRATVDASRQVHLSWRAIFGIQGCHWTFQGRFQAATEISGYLGFACDRGAYENPQAMTITKMVLIESAPDAGGQAAFLKRLLEEMAQGPVTEPYTKLHLLSSNPNVTPIPDDVQQQRLTFLTPASLRPLGRITAVIYVGDYIPIAGWLEPVASGPLPPPRNGPIVPYWGPVYGNKQPVYAVEFENGERLCTLHRRPGGVLDQFQCV